jgi:two-component system, cell cycle response regulator CpdR
MLRFAAAGNSPAFLIPETLFAETQVLCNESVSMQSDSFGGDLAMRILVAETDVPFLAEMKQALEQAGHDVTTFTNGMAAWNSLVSAVLPPDLLVTRAHLGPGMPPGTALGLHAHSRQPPIPVIYIPASVELAKHADPAHGAVLIKPFAVTELVETVHQLLGH